MSRVSNFSDKITVKNVIQTKDNYGGITESFTDLFDLWCNVTTVYSRQKVTKARNVRETLFKITLRDDEKSSQITYNNKIYYNQKLTNISEIKDTKNDGVKSGFKIIFAYYNE
jgi:head-tail adaptor